MTLNITHKGIDLTTALKDYVEEKMHSLEKYLDSIEHIDVEVGRSFGHKSKDDVYECKAIVKIAGEVIKVERDCDDLYKAINKVRDHLRVELTDWKRRMQERT